MVFYKYEPEITLEQIMSFDPERPETYTKSDFINKLCLSFAKNGILRIKDMARSIGVEERRFSHTFEVLTGIRYVEARPIILEHKARELHRLHPRWGTKRIAEELGFRSIGSLWALLPKDFYHELRPETKTSFLRKMAAEFDKETLLLEKQTENQTKKI